ncbi:MAG: tetratricopeptide repeat protein [Myxococcota bacterium]
MPVCLRIIAFAMYVVFGATSCAAGSVAVKDNGAGEGEATGVSGEEGGGSIFLNRLVSEGGKEDETQSAAPMSAASSYDKGYKAAPEAYAHYIRGYIAESEGDMDAALKEYKKALVHDDSSAALYSAVAHILARVGRFEEAESYCAKALERDEGYVKAYMALSRIYVATGRIEKATEALERVILLDVEKTGAFDILATLYLAQKNERKAIETYEKLSRLYPGNVEGNFRLGALFWRQGETERAEDVFKDILRYNPDDKRTLITLGVLYEQREMYGKAREIYERVAEIFPDDSRVQISLLKLALRSGKSEVIERRREEIRQTIGDELTARLQLGMLFFEERDYKRAEEELRRALDINQTYYPALMYLAFTLRKQKRYNEAEELVERIKMGDENWIRSRLFKTELLMEQKRYEEALAFIGTLAENYTGGSDSPDVLSTYAAALHKAGKSGDAARVLEDAAEASAPSLKSDFYYALGNLYELMKERDKAIEAMHLAITLNPEHAGALNFIGYTYAEEGIKLDEAEAYIQRALAERPEDGYITDSLGWVYFKKGEYKKALEILQRANVLSPWTPEILLHLGEAYLAIGEKEKALPALKNALKCDPDEEMEAKIKEALKRVK